METTTLPIRGYRDEAVPNHFQRQDDATDHLALVLPGFGYTCDMPLLYYTVGHLLDRGPMCYRSSTTTGIARSTGRSTPTRGTAGSSPTSPRPGERPGPASVPAIHGDRALARDAGAAGAPGDRAAPAGGAPSGARTRSARTCAARLTRPSS